MFQRDEDPGLRALQSQWRDDRLASFDQTVPEIFRAPIKLPDEVQGWLARQRDGQCENLVLVGPFGTGKTHTAWRTARLYVAEIPAQAEVISGTEFARGVRGDTLDATVDRLQAAHLLVLDDLGGSVLTPWVSDALFAVIDHRYQWRRPTLITTNHADLRSVVGERIASRLAQHACVVRMLGNDRRRQP